MQALTRRVQRRELYGRVIPPRGLIRDAAIRGPAAADAPRCRECLKAAAVGQAKSHHVVGFDRLAPLFGHGSVQDLEPVDSIGRVLSRLPRQQNQAIAVLSLWAGVLPRRTETLLSREL